MGIPVRERPFAAATGRMDPRIVQAVGWSAGLHVLVIALAFLLALYAPEPTVFEGPAGPVVDLIVPRGDSKVFKIGPLVNSGRRVQAEAPPKPAEPAKPEPPKAEEPKAEPPKAEVPKPEPPKPVEQPKVEPPKPSKDAIPEPKKEPPRPEPVKQPEVKKEPPKPEPRKEEPKKPEPPKKEEAKKPEPRPEPKKEPAKPDAKKEEPKKPEARKEEARQPPKDTAKAPPDAKPGEKVKPGESGPGSAAPTASEGLPGAQRPQENAGQTGDPNGGGGGAGNRSPEFYAYIAYIYQSVKGQWVWNGEQDAGLAATIRFSILSDGTISDVRITERSRSTQYDDSALNAVRATGSLTPPPASIRADFEDMELVFSAGDMMQKPLAGEPAR
jgi:colicin import membrane protein